MVASLAVRRKVKEEHFIHEASPTPSSSSHMSSSSSMGGRGKRKTTEEETGSDREKKRKLMNRVAAQQSRDRKRMYMDNLEKEIKKLKTENAVLKSTNLTIQEEKERLASENAALKSMTVPVKLEEAQSVNEISSSVTIEPAEFINEFPLQKGQVTLGLVFWLMHFLSILSPTTSQMSSLVCSKKFGRISVEDLIQRHLHTSQRGDAEVAGQVVGPSPAELESLQEFLQFECGLSPSFTFIAGEEEEDCSSSSSPSGSSSPEVNVVLVMPPTSVYNADCSSPSTSSPSSSPHHSITSSTSSSDSGVASTADLTEFLEETLFDMDVDAFLRSLEDSNGLAFLSDRL